MLDSRTFSSGHIIFMYNTIDTGEKRFIFGVSRRSELTAIGGRSEYGETLMSTLIREYAEEAHESIVSISKLVSLIENARRDISGSTVSVFIDLGEFDFERARCRFRAHTNFLSRRITPISRRELIDLVSAGIQDVSDSVRGISNTLTIRAATSAAIRIFLGFN